ncbi:hypothetical protein SAMN04488103_11445 [Gemmobacter aquatilis]|uniref:Uncharacterized protein n=1 Tax=Gemmobacter aquatilis TaxID=933059 RepID=A0A1H8MRM1_9RHOB|nr:hypothetical protein [Gemmobacter aquatilis]SEO20075.1 hypothetical protein SAMN04488103_11445 [Gemmobacter aquatilis]
MELTTGAILRRIIETPLSTGAHRLATIILDGIAWKDGFNGLERGTAAFTLAHLAARTGVSRQHLTALLVELASSRLALVRWKPNGKFAPWLFRFSAFDEESETHDVVSAEDNTSLSRVSKNKTIFSGKIEIGTGSSVYQTPWADMIKAAKASLACWNVDTQVIWERFLAFNRSRGNAAVPAGFLLGFMRRWRSSPDAAVQPVADSAPERSSTPENSELHRLIAAAPSKNWQFHASDLTRAVGQAGYDKRIIDLMQKFGCPRFAAILAAHGQAVLTGEIAR